MASTTTRRVTQLRCAPYRASLTYRWAGSWGRRLSLWMIDVFAWGDRCLEDSLAYRATLYAAGRLKRVFSGSLFVKWLWPYVRMAVVPYGEKVTVETALGLVLALACVGPTEIIMLASAGCWSSCSGKGAGRLAPESGRLERPWAGWKFSPETVQSSSLKTSRQTYRR